MIEAAHTEAWSVLNEYRDILDALAGQAARAGDAGPQGPRGHLRGGGQAPQDHPVRRLRFSGLPSDRPPIKTPGELAIERGETLGNDDVDKPIRPNGSVPVPVGVGQSIGMTPGYPVSPGYPAGPPGQLGPHPVTPPPGQYPAHPGSRPTDAWTGGVLPGPLRPLPGWNNPIPPNGGPNGGAGGQPAPGTNGYPSYPAGGTGGPNGFGSNGHGQNPGTGAFPAVPGYGAANGVEHPDLHKPADPPRRTGGGHRAPESNPDPWAAPRNDRSDGRS